MARNKLSDLNDNLMAQMERLTNEDLKGEELFMEVKRSKAVSDLGKQIIANARLTLDAVKMVSESDGIVNIPSHLIGSEDA